MLHHCGVRLSVHIYLSTENVDVLDLVKLFINICCTSYDAASCYSGQSINAN